MDTHSRRLRMLALASAALTAVSAFAVVTVAPASADTAPASPTTPATVSADALPTVQTDGVVWTQVIVGNTVYVGGEFTTARPAGSAAGVNTVTRSNMLAYTLSTGALITSFAPSFNSTVRSIAASPDGKTIYVGGSFTTVNGVTKYRIVALDATSGALKTAFVATTNASVYSIVATAKTVYLGGVFTNTDGATRARAAAVDATTGAVKAWAPDVPDGIVRAMVVSPDGTKVVLGGNFSSVNGSTSPGRGMAMVDATTGTNLSWAIGQSIQNYGTDAAVFSLTTDGTSVYGTAYRYNSGTGTTEGSFKASWADGSIEFSADCHGDTYSIAVLNGVAYTASHAYDCSSLPVGFPYTGAYHRAVAFTANATGTLSGGALSGQPAPSVLDWYPDLTAGTYTGQSQAAWSVAAGNGYVVYGGEFPSVNGVKQSGLVRFATKDIAPNKEGPRLSGSTWVPTVVSKSAGSARVSWVSNWDRDNATLIYTVYRNGGTVPVYSVTGTSRELFDDPTLSFVDTGLTPGASVKYKVVATDPFGNSATSSTVTATVAGGTVSPYATQVLKDGATDYWRLDETAGSTTAYDTAGVGDLKVSGGVTLGASGAIAGDSDTGATLSNDTSATATTTTPVSAPNSFSEEAWFNTTSITGGRIVGFGDSSDRSSGSTDRNVYMESSGAIDFGIWAGYVARVISPAGYNDGKWHHVVATLDSNGMQLLLDGVLVANSTVNTAQQYSGFWKIGADAIGGWPGNKDEAFDGSLDDVAIYPAPLAASAVKNHYLLGSGQASLPPKASFTSTSTGAAAAFDASGSTDPDGSIASFAWDFGDGSTATGVAPSHTYSTAGTYTVKLTVTDNSGVTASTTKSVKVRGAITSAYAKRVLNDGAADYWRLDEPAGSTTSFDSAGTNDLTNGSGVTLGTTGALTGDTNTAATLSNASGAYAAASTSVQAPDSFSAEAWFNTTTTTGGRIVGFSNSTTADRSNQYDRQIYMDQSGTVLFGVFPNFVATVQSAPGFNDGKWHHAVATLGSNGMQLFIDGTLVGSRTDVTSGSSYSGFWRIGQDNLDGWPGNKDYAFDGSIDEVAIYPAPLSASTVLDHFKVGNNTAVAANQAPKASFTSTPADLAVAFDGSGSTDSDGSVASYAWDFGDSTSGTGVSPNHTYTAAGSYTVALTVTDDKGATDTSTKTVTVTKANVAPKASFTSTSADLAVAFDASGSTDSDGSVASYAWDFGDSTSGTGVSPNHTYTAAGSYTVALTVTDDKGATDTSTKTVTVTKANVAPKASFTSTSADLAVAFDASGSTDSDGSVASYAWDFGDGTPTGTGVSPSHTYTAAGSYTVALTVTDNQGATNTSTKTVTVTKANVAPKASFTSTVANLTATFDATGSTDSDGSIKSYAWDFGDSQTGTGASTTHAYAASGTYTVKLTVTDNQGATGSVSQTVTASAVVVSGAIASDPFTRTVTNGLGTATTGGAWTTSGGPSFFSVNGSQARLSTAAGTTLTGLLSGVSSSSTDVQASFGLSALPSTGSDYAGVVGRRVGTDFYSARALVATDGSVTLNLLQSANSLKSVKIAGLTYAVGDRLQIRVLVTGTSPTTVSAKVWKVGTTEPTAWQASITDSTAVLQAAGSVGISSYVSASATNGPIVFSVDDFVAVKPTN